MSKKFVVTVLNPDRDQKQLTVEDVDALAAHKQVYMRLSRDEEIDLIQGEDGKTVFDARKGFRV